MAAPNPSSTGSFWRDALSWRHAVSRRLIAATLGFGLYGVLVGLLHDREQWRGIEPTSVEIAGGVLILLLVFRTSASYERWWEARKLWGGIVNQSRNLAVNAIAYGPPDASWRIEIVRYVAAFCHATRLSLRGQKKPEDLERVVGPEAEDIMGSEHPPIAVLQHVADMLHSARVDGKMDGFAFVATDRERAQLLDHLGGCERILATPLPRVHAIMLRRLIVVYLLLLPITIVDPAVWMEPVVTMGAAYVMFGIDRIAHELEGPFSTERDSHLPLDDICRTIEGNLLALIRPDTEA